MPKSKKAIEPVDAAVIARTVADRVRQAQACSIASCKIPKPARLEVLELLRAEGLEVTKTQVRRPIHDQVVHLLATGAFVPLTALRTHIKGASTSEAKKAALELVAAGKARIVLRGGREYVVPPASPVIARERFAVLIKAVDASLKVMRAAAKKRNGATVLREDLRALIDPLLLELAAGPRDRMMASVADIARKLADPAVGLAFVPRVVGALAEGSDKESAKNTVMAAARKGEIELRPESGLGRLTDEERDLCVASSDGTLLSWIRVPEARQ